MPSIDKISGLLKNMSNEQRLELIRLCNTKNNKSKENECLLKLSNNYRCPYCNSNKIKKNGKALGKYPQFKCNNCGKNYSTKTNTIFFHTRKTIEIWQEYIELFSQGLSLRKIVEKIDKKINLKTAFYWRHKILKVLTNKNDNDKLGGIV